MRAGTLMLLLLLVAGFAQAQSVTRGTFRVIEKVQVMMEEERYDEALVELDELVLNTKKIPYDHALANQYLANTSIILDKRDKARQALETALKMEGLPPELTADLQLFYGTVLLGDDEFAAAADALEVWLSIAVDPKARQIFPLAYANYMSAKPERAKELMARCFAETKRQKIPDTWFQVYYRILFDLKDYDDAEQLALELVSRDPFDDQYWRLLASHYMQLERSNDALATIMLSYMNELVTKPEDLKRIVSMYGFVDIPETAARLLETWLAEDKIPTDADALKQLGNLWLLARERSKAKVALERAASSSKDGKTFQMLGGIFFEDEDWPAAHDAYRKALRLGGLDEPSRVSLLAGISAYRAGMNEEAKTALQDAAESSEYREQAESILKRLDDA